jgi:hypothetical protein
LTKKTDKLKALRPKPLAIRAKTTDGTKIIHIALYTTGYVDVAATTDATLDRFEGRVRDVWSGFVLVPAVKDKFNKSNTYNAFGANVSRRVEHCLRNIFNEMDEAKTWHLDVEDWMRRIVRREVARDSSPARSTTTRSAGQIVTGACVRANIPSMAWVNETAIEGVTFRQVMLEEAHQALAEKHR